LAGAVIFANSLAAFAGSETAETVVIAPRLDDDALRVDVFFAVVAVPRTPRVAAAIGIVVIARIADIFVVLSVPFTPAVLNRDKEEAPRYR
jgi:hypothetical protein